MALDPQVSHRNLLKNRKPIMRRKPDEDFYAWQEKARAKMGEMLGYPFEKAENDGFRIEWVNTDDPRFDETRFLFESEEDVTVNCHLLMPKEATGKIPLIIGLQGHTTGAHISMGRKVHEIDDEFMNNDHDIAIQIVERGYAALTLDQRGFGERGGLPNCSNCAHLTLQAMMLGRSIVGERCFDVSCAIDIIEKYFPQIDADKIALTGHSGGGVTTFHAAVMEPRIKASMPSGVFTGLFDCYGSSLHCSCSYVPGERKHFDMGDIAAMAAPRPQVIVNGEKDTGFPIHGTPAQWEVTKAGYEAAGAAENVQLIIGPEGHRFYADLAWPVFEEMLAKLGWKEK